MKSLVTFIEQFFWTMIWIFAVLIVGYFLLAWLRDRAGGNVLGQFASWVSSHAEPQ